MVGNCSDLILIYLMTSTQVLGRGSILVGSVVFLTGRLME